MLSEKNIIAECPQGIFILDELKHGKHYYSVMLDDGVAAICDSCYSDLSIANERFEYIASKRKTTQDVITMANSIKRFSKMSC